MPLDLETLDEVSRDFVTYIAEHRPDWLEHATSKLDERQNTHFVEFEFPDPAPVGGSEPLWISTYGKEVTIGLDAHHAHFPWPTDYNGEDGRSAPMEHLDALMTERLVIVSLWDQGRICSASSQAPEFLSGLQEISEGPQELRIRSWRGTYNRTLRSDWDTYLKLIDEHHSSVFRPTA